MRFLLCTLVLAASFRCFSQEQPLRPLPFRYLVLQTLDIMRDLQIPYRKGLERDSPFIKYQIQDSMGATIAFFWAEQTFFFNDTSKRFRYYKNPTLVISKQVDSMLRYSTDTTSVSYINAQSVMMHELTHYLQGWYDEPLTFPTSKEQYYSYLKMLSEQQAFAVAAYYFTKKYSPPKFNDIISSTESWS